MMGRQEREEVEAEKDRRPVDFERDGSEAVGPECPDGVLTCLFIQAPGILGETSPGLEPKVVFRTGRALSPTEIAALTEHHKLRFG